MPIANCFVREDIVASADVDGLARLWSEESGVPPDSMTVNVLEGVRQSGAGYAVMALLYLPTLWSAADVERLEVGLARALARATAVDPAEVHVITSVVESGRVVENGDVRRW